MTYEEYKKLRDSGKTPEQIKSGLDKTLFEDKGVFGILGEVGKGAIKGAGSTLYGLEQLGEKGARFVAKKVTGEDPGQQIKRPDIIKPTNTAQKVGFMGEQIGEFLIPSAKLAKAEKGMGLLGKMGLEGATMAGITSAQQGEIGKEAAIAGAFGTTMPVIGKGIELAGKAIKGTGKGVYGTAFTPNAKEAPALQKFKAFGENAPRLTEQTALEKGLAGTKSGLGVKALRAQKNLWDGTIAPAVKGIKEPLKTADLFDDVAKEISKIGDPSRKASLEKGLQALADDYKSMPTMTYEQAQKIKSELYKFIPSKMFKGEEVSGVYNTIRKALADSIRSRTYSKLGDINIKQSYLDWGNLQNIREAGIREMQNPKFKGGAGGLVGGLKDMVVTPVATYGGKTLYKAGNGIQFLGEKGINGMAEYLESLMKRGI